MADELYLGPYFGAAPGPPPGRVRVLYGGVGSEVFTANLFQVKSGFLLFYTASDHAGGIRLDLRAVFAPGGWNGYVVEDGHLDPLPVGFRPDQPVEDR